MPQHNNNTNNKGPKSGPDRYSLKAILAKALDDGEVMCGNIHHYVKRRLDNVDATGAPVVNARGNRSQRLVPVVKDHKEILTLIPTGGKASCVCERRACEWQWRQEPRARDGTYASRYVINGSYTMGIHGQEESGRRVYYLEHALNAEHFKILVGENPNKYFIMGNAHHDHPLAHARTKLATVDLWDRVAGHLKTLGACNTSPDKSYKVVDLFGNPAANKSNQKRWPHMDIVTTCQVQTPKDAIRSVTKWASADYVNADLRDLCGRVKSIPTEVAGTKVFVGIHTLYYLEMNDICAALNNNPGSVGFFVVHRHQGDSGTLNNGEQKWRRTFGNVDMIEQTNVKTGEKYLHPTLDHWFAHDAWYEGYKQRPFRYARDGKPESVPHAEMAIGKQGMAWTVGMLNSDTFLLTVTACPSAIAAMQFDREQYDAAVAHSYQQFASSAMYDKLVVHAGRFSHIFTVKGRKTFIECADMIAGKPRNASTFKDHLSRVKRTAKNNNDVDPGSVTEMAYATFLVGFDEDRSFTHAAMAKNEFEMGVHTNETEGNFADGYKDVFSKVLHSILIIADPGKSSSDKGLSLLRSLRNMNDSFGTRI